MGTRRFNEVAYFQVGIARKYMRRHGLTPLQFVERDKQYHILHLLEVGYEPFRLTGDEGVLDELDAIVAEQQAARSAEAHTAAPPA
ncbi:MAG: DUF3791 domain-containing protein [Clostridiales Family XIII bacterium]|jgi:hypothetical protein|nr:DUF3791 domain-containing protein [Clostridiales Family XIII bacterium]